MKQIWAFGNYRSTSFWLAILVLVCTFSKLFLIGKGFLAFPDETRVFASANLLVALSNANFSEAVTAVFSTKGRPGSVLLEVIPVTMQYVMGKIFGIATFHSYNNWPLFVFNFAAYLGIAALLYRIALTTTKSLVSALLAVLFFTCLTNGYIYLRHALPYDKSLFIYLFVLYKILRSEGCYTSKKSFWWGFLSFFGFLVYPGYILTYGVVTIFFFLFRFKRKEIDSRFKNVVLFALGGGVLFLFTELLSRAGKISYWEISTYLSSTIIQGDFSESYSFLFSYLLEIEGALGVALFLGILLYAAQFLTNKGSSSIAVLAVLTFSFWLLYASAGYFFHKVTFYGRLIHQFMPILCIMAGSSFGFIAGVSTLRKRLVLGTVITISIVSFTTRFVNYFTYDYPLDVAWHMEQKIPNVIFEEYCEVKTAYSTLKNYNEQQSFDTASRNWIITNACFVYPVPAVKEKINFMPPENAQLVYEKSYFQNFAPYRFEGLSPVERDRMGKLDLKIKVYQVLEK